jgi:NAD(P)-dependent dehydrogenase (short-subunit alcohol dehydrogenase family)
MDTAVEATMLSADAGRAPSLKDKVAVVFGAGGAVGGAVASELAARGADVFLSGRTRSRVQDVAIAISGRGGNATVAEVDALDEAEVNGYIDEVAGAAGRIDVLFNAMGPQPVEYHNATSTMELPVERFMVPFDTIVRSQFITARSAARHLIRQRSGVLLFLSATISRGQSPNTAAIGSAYGAIESLTRCLSTEFGPAGVRVVCVRSMGMAETRTMQQTYVLGGRAMGVPAEKMQAIIASRALLGRSPSVAETAALLAFLASDEAAAITGAIVNSSCGQVLD